VTHPDDQAEIQTRLSELTEVGRDHVEFETRLVHADGHVVWVLISGALLSDGEGEPALAITHVIDISDRKLAEHQLRHLADHDALTGLFNRRRFTEELTRTLRLAKRHGESGAVLFLDLDGFKFVNDTLGHAAGDKLIVRVAGLLGGAVRQTDTLARIGGDEFAILLTRCDRAAALVVGEKLLALLRQDGLADRHDRRPHVSSSIGVALFSGEDVVGPDELVVQADIAMYDAKNAGKDRCAVYDASAGPRSLMSARRSWNERLRRAIRSRSFVLLAQPIVPIVSVCATGTPAFELLIRLPDGNGDLIPPAAFLRNAEASGLVGQIDRWVLEQAVLRLRDSNLAGHELILSVNVSGATMGDAGLGEDLAELLRKHEIPPGSLVLELNEKAVIKNIDGARSLAQQVRGLGCGLAIDDFGAGFASFYYLKLLHFDYLKIDGEYIRDLGATPTDRLVVEAIVTLARGLGTRTIAEFVGDDATVGALRELGVDYAQGYHLGRPSPLERTLPYLLAAPVR
jgi:diguanylate cyclase (GGDEF)-like protein